jgi:hypothetical protein
MKFVAISAKYHGSDQMKFKRVRVLALALIFLSPLARAEDASIPGTGLFIEPMATLEVGSTSIHYPSPLSDSSGSATGFGLGGRLGFHFIDVLFAGLDARYAMPTFKDSSTNYQSSAVGTNWGPVVGVQVPILGLRAWASYIWGGDLNPESSGGYDVKFSEASGYRIGAGWKFLLVSLNLEYQSLVYGKTTLEQVGPFSANTSFDNVQLTDRAWIASVSIPIGL